MAGPLPGQIARDAVIAFRNVSKMFGRDVLALDNVNWSILPGQRTCLLGPNGAGKSTSIRLLTGALRPTSGQVLLLGESSTSDHYPDAKRRAGIVPQNPGMYADLSVHEYLHLARALYGRGNVAQVIEAFGLGEHQHKRMAQLSGGFQRRVSLAAAVLSQPDILLLDEPTSGLDPVAARDILEYLREAMAGRTTLFCTHNLAEAEALCDDIVILQSGRVRLHELLADLRARAHARLRLGCVEGTDTLSASLEALGYAPRIEGDRVTIAVTDVTAEPAVILRNLFDLGLGMLECTPIIPSLEDMFLSVVGYPSGISNSDMVSSL